LTNGDAGTADPPTIVLHVDCSRITHSFTVYFTGPQNSQNLRSYLQNSGTGRVKWRKSHSEEWHSCSGLWTWLLSGVFCSENVNWYMFLTVRKELTVFCWWVY